MIIWPNTSTFVSATSPGVGELKSNLRKSRPNGWKDARHFGAKSPKIANFSFVSFLLALEGGEKAGSGRKP